MPKISGLTAGATATGAEKIPAVQGGVTVRLTPAQLTNVVRPEDYGALGDGSTDDYAAFAAALAALYAADGGTLKLAKKRYRINTAIVLTNDGTHTGSTPSRQPAIQIIGEGSWASGQGGTVEGCTILDIRSSDVLGHIQSYGLGLLVLEDFHLTDGGNSGGNPFIFHTATTLKANRISVIGSSNVGSATCNQDAIISGGTGTDYTTVANGPFQGYGTIIRDCYFDRIRRGWYARTYCNGCVFSGNTFWNASGTNLASGAAVEILGDASNNSVGNHIDIPILEIGSYVYGVKLTKSSWNYIKVAPFDDTVTTLNAVHLTDSNSGFNTIVGNHALSGSKAFFSQATGNTSNIWLNNDSGTFSFFPNLDATVLKAGSVTAYSRTGGMLLSQPSTAGSESDAMLRVLRSAAEASDPAGTIWSLVQGGTLSWGGSLAGNITNAAAAGVSYTANGRSIVANGSGGAMTINSGTGGSFLTQQHFGVKYNTHAGTLYAQIGGGFEGIKFGAALDVGVARNAADIIEINSGTLGALRDLTLRALTATSLTASTGITTAGLTGTVQSLSGAGALNITTLTTAWTTTGAGNAGTLADGAVGQFKHIVHVVDGGSGVLTPANLANGTTITFTNVGEAAMLQFLGTEWHVMSLYGAVLA
jgi:hypothetical protein